MRRNEDQEQLSLQIDRNFKIRRCVRIPQTKRFLVCINFFVNYWTNVNSYELKNVWCVWCFCVLTNSMRLFSITFFTFHKIIYNFFCLIAFYYSQLVFYCSLIPPNVGKEIFIIREDRWIFSFFLHNENTILLIFLEKRNESIKSYFYYIKTQKIFNFFF